MCGKGSNTTTQTQTSSPNPAMTGIYNALLQRGQSIAGQDYQPYGGQLVAPMNDQQMAGIGGINANANFASPYITQAADYMRRGAAPISAEDIQRYQNPYTQNVVDATQRQFTNANAEQQQQITGNAAAQGALGGDRVSVAKAEGARQQKMAQDPVIAGLYSHGFDTALGTAERQQQNWSQAGFGLGNLGISGQNAALQGAGAQLGAGGLMQQNQQALNQANYGQYMQQLAFPYQQAGWLAQLAGGIGSQYGGTTTGSTTQPPPNPWNAIGGIGAAGLGALGYGGAFGSNGFLGGLFNRRSEGGRVPHKADGGSLTGTFGGMPYSGGQSFIPSLEMARGAGLPKLPSLPQQPQSGAQTMLTDAIKMAGQMNSAKNRESAPGYFGGSPETNPTALAPIGAATDDMAFGGAVEPGIALRGYDDGGTIAPEDFSRRFAGVPSVEALAPEEFGGRFIGRPGGPATDSPAPPLEAPPVRGIAARPPARTITLPRPEPTTVGLGGLRGDDVPPVRDRGGIDLPRAAGGDRPAEVTDEQGVSTQTSPWLSLMHAGLGMMASKSPFLGTAVGEGGLAGLQNYTQQQGVERAEKARQDQLAIQKQSANLAASRLAQSARQHAEDLALRTRQFEQGVHQYEVPAGFRKSESGIEAIPGGPHDPATLRREAEAKRVPGMTDEALGQMVQSYRAGNTGVLMGVGRGVQGADNMNRFWNIMSNQLKEEGVSGRDLAAAKVNFTAQSAAARTAATREANVAAAVEEAKATFPLALQRSAEVPRTQFVPWNQAVQMVQRGTSSPELARFVTANQAVITAYSQAMSRTGVNTVHAQQHAENLLSTATSQEAYQAVIGQMEQEMQAALHAPETVKKRILEGISAPPERRGAAPPPATTAPAAAPAFKPPATWEYSESRKQYRDPATKKMYDMTGKEIP